MKYKIYRKIHRELKVESCNGSRKTKLIEKVLYFAERKGRIFGFWHDVGQEVCGYEIGDFITPEYFETVEECEDFVKKFHIYHYGNTKIEIYKELDIK